MSIDDRNVVYDLLSESPKLAPKKDPITDLHEISYAYCNEFTGEAGKLLKRVVDKMRQLVGGVPFGFVYSGKTNMVQGLSFD